MAELTIGILFGGISEEHPISVKSAREVALHLDCERYQPYWIGITPDGAWLLCDGPDGDWAASGRPVLLAPSRDIHGLVLTGSDGPQHVRLDVVLPVLHGTQGEDGAIQGLLELSGIPYVGCDVQTSALCMDKSLTYLVASSAGVLTPRHWIVIPEVEIDAARLPYPIFVKPARSGSSFGVTKVGGPGELDAAVATARQYDSKVLIEEAVVASEVGCAILGRGSDLFVGEPDRVALSHGFFRIHQEATPESGSENSTFIVPADISPGDRSAVVRAATTVYQALGCTGLARVDMFLTTDGTVVLNEVNTLPGLTSYSRYPRMMAAAGLALHDVIDRVVADALEASR